MTKIDDAYARLAVAIVRKAKRDINHRHKYIRWTAREFFRGKLWANIRDTYNLDEGWTDQVINKWIS